MPLWPALPRPLFLRPIGARTPIPSLSLTLKKLYPNINLIALLTLTLRLSPSVNLNAPPILPAPFSPLRSFCTGSARWVMGKPDIVFYPCFNLINPPLSPFTLYS
jgi:hypothetical protein